MSCSKCKKKQLVEAFDDELKKQNRYLFFLSSTTIILIILGLIKIVEIIYEKIQNYF